MHNWMRGALIAVVASAVTAIVVSQMIRNPVAGQTPDRAVARAADGKPNLNGIWQALGTAHWDLQDHPARSGPVLELGAVGALPAGQGVVEGNEIPYQPWAAARKKENFDNWVTRDPEVKCYLPGVPRATYMPFPFQIVQTADNIVMAYEYASASRIIKIGKVDPAPVDTWMGQSAGRWEGDTLVVDVTSFNDQTWFDRAGNFHSEALHVVERYTPRQSGRPRLPGHDRGSESVHAPLEDQNAAVPEARHERSAPRVQVRRVRRGDDVRESAQEDRSRKAVQRRTPSMAVGERVAAVVPIVILM